MLLLHTLLRPIFLAAVVETGRTCKISTVLPVFSRLFSYWTSTSHIEETASRTPVPPSGPIFLLFGSTYRIVVFTARSVPRLVGPEDRHCHRRIPRQVPAVTRLNVRQEEHF